MTGQIGSQAMQHELLTYAIRHPGEDRLSRWLYERYLSVAAEMCRCAAAGAGEVCAISLEQLARLMVARLDGLMLQYLCDPDDARARADLLLHIDMVIHVAGITRPTRPR